jgi:DNA polymerase, archaea type
MKTKFIPIDYDYFDYKGRNYIKIIGKNEKDKKICVIDTCQIYFWAILKEKIKPEKLDILLEKIKKIKIDSKDRETKIQKVELHEKNFLGKKIDALKIFTTNYKDLHAIADKLCFPEIEKRRGYDLGFITHYIIEKSILPSKWCEIEGEILNNSEEFGGIDSVMEVDYCIKLEKIKDTKDTKFIPKILSFDIETDEIRIGAGEILMISLYSEGFNKVITWKKNKGKKPPYVEYVKKESELIEKFIEYIKRISPDFLVGYFSDGFDLPYLKARAEKFKIKLSLGIDGTQPKFNRGRNLTGKISGIVHIDLLRFIRNTYSQYMQSETLSLNEVSREFLGDKKKEFDLKHSSKIKKENWEKYYEYNLHDSKLVFDLTNKFWQDIIEFSKIMQEPIFNITRNGMSKNVESYIIHNLKKFNEIPEKRPGYSEISERRLRQKYQGAYVFQPTPGIYKDLAIFDFTSMHASIIVSHNLSKATLLEEKQKDSYESPEFELNNKKTKFYFSKEPGFFPSLLKEIVELRKKYKKELKKKPNAVKKARSNAYKLLANAYYGYLGFFGARYYSIEAAASTLAFVRKFNKWTIDRVNNQGYKVIFGDTDSVGFLLNNKSRKQTLEFLKKLNSELPGIMELELEGFFKRGLWVSKRGGNTGSQIGAKKKYALIDEKEKIKIRGFETVRRDWCTLARETQNKIIKMVLEQGNEKKALKYLIEIVKKIKNREIKKEKLIIKTQLKKSISEYLSISPHVVAAKKMKEQEIPISQGGIVEYYIAETKPFDKKKLVREKVKLPHEEGEYNKKYYLENQILPAVENIFQVFKIDINEIIEGKKQMTLGDF